MWLLFLDGVPPASVTVYGCGLNPSGSLLHLGGTPSPGGAVLLGLNNPLATQGAGAATFVMVSLAPWLDFPCGLAIPGTGMAGPGASGGLLIDPTAYVTTVVGPVWTGPASPAVVPLFVPANDALLGLDVYVQGLIVDPGEPVELGLTEGAELGIGN